MRNVSIDNWEQTKQTQMAAYNTTYINFTNSVWLWIVNYLKLIQFSVVIVTWEAVLNFVYSRLKSVLLPMKMWADNGETNLKSPFCNANSQNALSATMKQGD